MKKFLLLLLLLVAFAVPKHSFATDLFVSPTGSGTTCSSAVPCSPATADGATLGSPTTCASADGFISRPNIGKCIHWKPGTYTGPFDFTHSGTASAGIMHVSDTKWGAILNTMDWTEEGSFVTIAALNGTNPTGVNAFGIQLIGANINILWNNLHNFATNSCPSAGIIIGTNLNPLSANQTHDDIIQGNIIRQGGDYTGLTPQGNPNSNSCVTYHGIYEDGTNVSILNNIISGVSGWGIKSDCTTTTVISGNLVFNNGGGISPTEQNDAGFCAAWDYNTVTNNVIVNNGVDTPNGGRFGIDYFHVGTQAAPEGRHNLVAFNLMYGNKPADLAYKDGTCQGAPQATATGTIPAQGIQITNNDVTGLGGCPFDSAKTDTSTAVTFTAFQTDTPTAPAANFNPSNYQLGSNSNGRGTGTQTCAQLPPSGTPPSPCFPSVDYGMTTRAAPFWMGPWQTATLSPPLPPTGVTVVVH